MCMYVRMYVTYSQDASIFSAGFFVLEFCASVAVSFGVFVDRCLFLLLLFLVFVTLMFGELLADVAAHMLTNTIKIIVHAITQHVLLDSCRLLVSSAMVHSTVVYVQ
jgi:hypothetical protein